MIPNALAIGISYEEFGSLNPKKIKLIRKGYEKKIKEQLEYDNVVSHIQGYYFLHAMYASVGNMFSSSNSKKHEYPQNPIDLSAGEISEENLQKQRELFLASLQVMKTNFELSEKKEV